MEKYDATPGYTYYPDYNIIECGMFSISYNKISPISIELILTEGLIPENGNFQFDKELNLHKKIVIFNIREINFNSNIDTYVNGINNFYTKCPIWIIISTLQSISKGDIKHKRYKNEFLDFTVNLIQTSGDMILSIIMNNMKIPKGYSLSNDNKSPFIWITSLNCNSIETQFNQAILNKLIITNDYSPILQYFDIKSYEKAIEKGISLYNIIIENLDYILNLEINTGNF